MSVALQTNGRVVVGGYSSAQGNMGSVLVRYRANGRLDPSVSDDGKIVGHVTGDGGANDVAIQPDGRILLASQLGTSFLVTRYNGDGTLDSTSGDEGTASITVTDWFASGGALALQPDGKIVVAGEASHSDCSVVVDVLRLDTDGALDTWFGSDGGAAGRPHRGLGLGRRRRDPVRRQDRRRGQAGFCCGCTGSFGLTRFDADGTLDATFGGDGIVITNFTGTNGGEPPRRSREPARRPRRRRNRCCASR